MGASNGILMVVYAVVYALINNEQKAWCDNICRHFKNFWSNIVLSCRLVVQYFKVCF